MTDHLMTVDIEPFEITDHNGHDRLVLAAVFELRHLDDANTDKPIARLPTENEARALQAKLDAEGIETRVSVRALESIDLTAVAPEWSYPLDDLATDTRRNDDPSGWAA